MLAEAILIGLAGWRLAHLLVVEDGPWHLSAKFREVVGVYKEGELGFYAELFSCIWCTSAWTCACLFGLYAVLPEAVVLLAAWGIASGIEAARQNGQL